MDVTAGGFIYARRDRYMRFERTMHMDRAGQLIDADDGHGPPVSRSRRDRCDRAARQFAGHRRRANGHAANRCRRATSISIMATTAGRWRTRCWPARGEIRSRRRTVARISGLPLIHGDGPGAGRQRPRPSTRATASRSRCRPPTRGARTIRSNTLNAVGASQGIREMTFREGVEYREAATKAHPLRIARARDP